MPSLEELVVRRDRGFVVRLVLLLAAGLLAGLFMLKFLTSAETGSRLAGAFGNGAPPRPAPPNGQ